MLDCWQKLRKIIAMLHEILLSAFFMFAIATGLSAILAEQRRGDIFCIVGFWTMMVSIASIVGAFFTL